MAAAEQGASSHRSSDEAIAASPISVAPGTVSLADHALMSLALALGARNRGRAWPNPSVGAIVVRETGEGPVTLARGITSPGGRPHAERIALDAAGEGARGATLYVSLEPCSHHGRTPPCADSIINSGITRVVTALEDPDPRVAGSGHARLAAAGIRLDTGLQAEAARRAHRGHIMRVTQGRPAVTVKLAMTADGFAAGPPGAPRLKITGATMDAQVHLMRAHADAIMAGAGTVLADDPRLDVRLPGMADRSPVRIVVDTHLRLAGRALRILETVRTAPVWVLAGETADAAAERKLVAAGAEVMRVPLASDGRVDLAQALTMLAARGLTHILCEGGPVLAEALAQRGLVDEVVRLTGTHTLGAGQHGIPAFGPAIGAYLAGEWTCYDSAQHGMDVLERFERRA